MSAAPYPRKERPNTVAARASITMSASRPVAKLVITSPARYSGIESGVAKIFRKLRDQTSSRNAVVTPCMMRLQKSQKSTAPSRRETKLNAEKAMEFRYLVINPQRTMSMATQAMIGSNRAGLPRRR